MSRVLLGVALCLGASRARAQALVVATDPEQGAVAKAEIRADCPLLAANCKRRPSQQVMSLFGLRGSETVVSGPERAPKAGLTLMSTAIGHLQDAEQHSSGRVGHFAFIGGGRGGIEGGIGIDLALGLYQPVSSWHGPFSRVGGRAELLGNAAFYSSLVELPQLQLGYGALRHGWRAELAARGGPVLIGRYKTPEGGRKLGGAFEWGAIASLGAGPVDAEVEWTRIETRGPVSSRPVDVLRVNLCGGGDFALGVCFDVRLTTADVGNAGGERVSTWFLGLTLGALVRERPDVR